MQLVSIVVRVLAGWKKDRDKKCERLSLIRTQRQRAGVVWRHLNTGQQQLESVSNSSVLHTASPSGERGAARTLLESYTVSHFPPTSPCVSACVLRERERERSVALITQPL